MLHLQKPECEAMAQRSKLERYGIQHSMREHYCCFTKQPTPTCIREILLLTPDVRTLGCTRCSHVIAAHSQER
jgi:hypothetical protein